ncbi:hypothetical protein BJ875DRAFT_530831 [Amylocarpus encephaloides]|uniref:Uncharacterized protein n=1 Tax=Amylocarpus encephaloides TaxID=45428 RepID=A0A9P7YJA4_9HELO|nr:hypothetical protein BJ875DRAFT_530831 [Amylocarpus encephaloides]
MATNQTPAQYARIFYNAEKKYLGRGTKGLDDTINPTLSTRSAQLRYEYRQAYPTRRQSLLGGAKYGLVGTCPPLTANHLSALPPTHRRQSRFGNALIGPILVAGPLVGAVAGPAIAGLASAPGPASTSASASTSAFAVGVASVPGPGISSAGAVFGLAIAGPSYTPGPAPMFGSVSVSVSVSVAVSGSGSGSGSGVGVDSVPGPGISSAGAVASPDIAGPSSAPGPASGSGSAIASASTSTSASAPSSASQANVPGSGISAGAFARSI